MISVEHLTKCYGDFMDDLSFEIEDMYMKRKREISTAPLLRRFPWNAQAAARSSGSRPLVSWTMCITRILRERTSIWG